MSPPAESVLTELPPAPDYLPNDEAKTEWARLSRLLLEAGRLDELKLSSLGIYCSLHGKITGMMRGGLMPSGHVLAQYRGLARELGIVQASPQAPTDGNEPKKPSRWASLKDRAQKSAE